MIRPNLLVNREAENSILSPWVIDGSGVPAVDTGSANSGYNPFLGLNILYDSSISSGSTSTLMQIVLLLNDTQGYAEIQLNSGNLSAYISFYELNYSQ
jgi:hypothetical protein